MVATGAQRANMSEQMLKSLETRSTVNRVAVGSNPTQGAIFLVHEDAETAASACKPAEISTFDI